MKNRKYVIVDSRRFFAFVTFMLVICTVITTSVFSLQKVHGDVYEQNYKEYTVLFGDSLWGISLNHMPKNYDVRRMVFDIKELNSMETSYIYQGDTIKIPVYKE